MDRVVTAAYGQRLGERVRIENPPAIVTWALSKGKIAVTELRCDIPLQERSGSLPQEDAFLVALHLRDFPNREYWEDGRRASVCDLRAGETSFYDLKRDPTILLDKPYHTLAFYLPRAALDAIADEANAPRIRDLSHKTGACVNDVTISSLGSLLLPAFSHPDQASRLFLDHVMLAFACTSLGPMEACGQCRGCRRGARAMAGATREGNSSRQPRGRCAAQGVGARVPPVGRSFLARLPSHAGSAAAQLAESAAHRAIQGKTAR
jgi:hypothetical protein